MTAGKTNVTLNQSENSDDEAVTAPLGLKILVVVLGIAIMGMLGLMAYKIMAGDMRSSKPSLPAKAAISVVSGQPVEFDELTIKKPMNSKLVTVEIHGQHVVARYRNDTGVTLVFVDRYTGSENRVIIPD